MSFVPTTAGGAKARHPPDNIHHGQNFNQTQEDATVCLSAVCLRCSTKVDVDVFLIKVISKDQFSF